MAIKKNNLKKLGSAIPDINIDKGQTDKTTKSSNISNNTSDDGDDSIPYGANASCSKNKTNHTTPVTKQDNNEGIKYSDFKIINRDKEDELIYQYQRTKDKSILEQLYHLREQTLGICARRYSYLANNFSNSYEDLLGDLKIVWLKCINQYQYEEKSRRVRSKKGHLIFDQHGVVKVTKKRTPFNTFLYTSIRNHMSNIYKRKHMKKKTNTDGCVIEDNMMSIDQECSNDDNNSITLHNFLVDTKSDSSSSAATQTLIHEVSMGDPDVTMVLSKYAKDPHITTIASACGSKYVYGSIKVNEYDFEFFKNNNGVKAKQKLKKIIDNSGKYPKSYKLSNFSLSLMRNNRLKSNAKLKRYNNECYNDCNTSTISRQTFDWSIEPAQSNRDVDVDNATQHMPNYTIKKLSHNASNRFKQKYAISRSVINPYRVNSIYGLIFDILYFYKNEGVLYKDVIEKVACLTKTHPSKCRYNVETVASARQDKSGNASIKHALPIYWVEKNYRNGNLLLQLRLHNTVKQKTALREIYFELKRKNDYVLRKTTQAIKKYKQKKLDMV